MKIVSVITFLLLASIAAAQVSLTAVPPGPRFTLDDLWNVTVIKTSGPARGQEFTLTMNMYDSKGARLVTQTSKSFKITRNIFTVNRASITNVQPMTTSYDQKKFQNQLGKKGGMVPEGDYKVEFVLNQIASPGAGPFSEPIVRTSYMINALLSYPIQLVNVPNNDTITDQYPNFNWLPPYPLPEGVITYEIEVREAVGNQSPQAAIAEGVPMVKNIMNNKLSYNYAATNPKLANDRTYAWKVNMFENGNFYMASETWEFTYRVNIDSATIIPQSYFVMQPSVTHMYAVIDSNLLPIKFVEDYSVLDSIFELTLYDVNYEVVADGSELTVYGNTGSNYCYINFCPDVFPLDNGLYVLEVELIHGRKFYLRFQNISAPGVCVE